MVPPECAWANSAGSMSDEIFQGRWRKIAERADSFAEQQAKLAKCATVRWLEEGEHLVEGLQGEFVLLCYDKMGILLTSMDYQCRFCWRGSIWRKLGKYNLYL